MTRIGVTGHQSLGDEAAVAWVRAAVNSVLGEHAGPLIGVSSLAAGADQVFAELVLERRGELEVVLPFHDYRNRGLQHEADRLRYDRLAHRAQLDIVAHESGSDEEAYLHAGRSVVARCELLVAVWNGAPARGLGGTADIVSYAHECGRATVIIDPVRRTVNRGDAAQPVRAAALRDPELNEARRIGDPLVDAVVSEYLAVRGREALGAVMGALFHTKGLPDHPLVNKYLRSLGVVDLGDSQMIARGQQLFGLFGPEIFIVLGSCSLPLAFAAGNGVQAIYRARRLKDDAVRRLFDTAQMIINVMQVGELERGKLGWRASCKVRLMHAVIRYHLQQDQRAPWSYEWGTPINQEDLAGTLLCFSAAVLHGLKRMGAKISQEDADSYVYAWSAIGRLLGIDTALLASTEAEALLLAERIGRRQIRATVEGKLLAEQLMRAVATLFPIPGYACSLTHFFLTDTAFGSNVAQVLALPEPGCSRVLVAARAWQKRRALALLGVVPGARSRRSFLARRFVQRMISLKRPEGDAPFEVPEAFAQTWRVRRSRRATPDRGDAGAHSGESP